jgi:hypothetical protein
MIFEGDAEEEAAACVGLLRTDDVGGEHDALDDDEVEGAPVDRSTTIPALFKSNCEW